MFARDRSHVLKVFLAASLLVTLVLMVSFLLITLLSARVFDPSPVPVVFGLAGLLVLSEIGISFGIPTRPFTLPVLTYDVTISSSSQSYAYQFIVRSLIFSTLILAAVSIGHTFWWGVLTPLLLSSLASLLSTKAKPAEDSSSLDVVQVPIETDVEPTYESNDDNASLKLTRRLRTLDTSQLDEIEALIRFEFAADEDLRIIHLPIHPPFPSTPEVDVELAAGENCRVNVTDAKSFGVRIEIKRSRSTTSAKVELAVLIYSEVGSSAVA